MPRKTASGMIAYGIAAVMLVFLLVSGGCSAAETAAAHCGIDTWSALQEALYQAENGDMIVLSGDLTASSSDAMLVIETGKCVTLDLNGHTLDRNLKERAKDNGCVLYIRKGAILTLRDSGEKQGLITGGSYDNGGGIQNYGTLIMEGGCVTGNTGLCSGGGVSNYGTMVFTGGSITGNTALEDGSDVYNGEKGNLTAGGDAVIGDSQEKNGGIRNEGTLTVIDMPSCEVHIEDMPVIRRFIDQQSILPIAALLLVLLLTVRLDAYLSRERMRVMMVIIALVFGLVFQNYWDNQLSLANTYNVLRIPLSVLGYVLRPVILVMFLYIVKPDGRYRAAWVLIGANTAVYMTAFFSNIAFDFSSYGHFRPGPLHHTCTLVSAVLYAWLFFLTIQQFRPRERKESWIPSLVTVLIGGAVAMDFTAIFSEQPISFLTMAIAISCVFYYFWLHLQFVREHEDNLRAGQRVRIMLSQIQPHFLFNSLEVIRRLYRKEPEKADDALVRFEQYLRGNLDSLAREELIPFRTELEHTRTYLELEQLRFPDELHIVYDLQCTEFNLPPLTLQPLAENAVRHGVREKKSGEGTVTIASREYGDRYEIGVTDDGNGFDPEAVSGDDHPHIALDNVRERLRYTGADLRIGAGPEGGTEAVIIIPKQGKQEGEKP